MALDMPDVVAPSPDKNPRLVSFDMRQSDMEKVPNLKPGDEVRVMLVGEVIGVEMHEPYGGESDEDYVAYVRVEAKRVKVEKRNEFADLAEDD